MDQNELSDVQAALRHALQQLEALTGSGDDMRDVHAKLEQQSQALQSMQETFDAVEAEKAQEHEQTLTRCVIRDPTLQVQLKQVSFLTCITVRVLIHDCLC